MSHVQGHIDSEKQRNLDLVDLTQCTHCYQQFGTPFEMQCHVEKVNYHVFIIIILIANAECIYICRSAFGNILQFEFMLFVVRMLSTIFCDTLLYFVRQFFGVGSRLRLFANSWRRSETSGVSSGIGAPCPWHFLVCSPKQICLSVRVLSSY